MKGRLFATLVAIVALVSCGKESQLSFTATGSNVTVSSKGDVVVTAPQGGTSAVLKLTASQDWTASVMGTKADASSGAGAGDGSWCSVSPSSGPAGEVQITVSTRPNTTYDERGATIVFTSGDEQKTITVTQDQMDAIVLSERSYEVSPDGGEISVQVSHNIDFTCSINVDWIKDASTKALKTDQKKFKVDAYTESGTRTGVITFSSKDGSVSQQVTVSQTNGTPSYVEPEAVDLGLSVKWASFNLGATKPEESGLSFMWGDTVGYGHDLSDGLYFGFFYNDGSKCDIYKWFEDLDIYSGKTYFSKYVPSSKAADYGYEGFYDDKTVLDPEDDAATAALGDKWRTPTKEEWDELMDPENCEWTADENSDGKVDGYFVRSKKQGFTDKSIYLPKNYQRFSDDILPNGSNPERCEIYWSSTLYEEKPNLAYSMMMLYRKPTWVKSSRSDAIAIRPVASK